MAQVLSYPFPSSLAASRDGRTLAYAIDRKGLRSLWVARAPQYVPHEVAATSADDGQGFRDVTLSRDGSRVIYAFGAQADVDANPTRPLNQLWSVCVSKCIRTKTVLGEGHSPAIAPDGSRVAFERGGEVWSASLDGRSAAKRLFYDEGRDSQLEWSPSGNALAFVSSRGDHAFIGVYRNGRTPLQFLAPAPMNDTEPRWSPDGTRIAFVRTPGAGGEPQSPLAPLVVPWSIWVLSVSDGAGHAVWESPHTPRGSFPTQGGDVDLYWAANDRIVFASEMDNWPHLYAIRAAGGSPWLLTPGRYSVGDVMMSADLRYAFYNANTGASPQDVDRSHLYRVDVGNGSVATLTAGKSSEWSPTPLGANAFAYVRATAQQPPLVMLSRSLHGDSRALDAALLPSGFPTAQMVTPREVTIDAPDGTLVHAQAFAAPGAARRPAIVFVHGGPMRQMLLTWNPMAYYSNAYAVDQYLVRRGFAVLSVNYRSGTGYGHDFHYALRTGWTGASEYQDVLAAAHQLQAMPMVDPARIGIWGGSWGGYLTALALARNSDLFKAGVDFSGVHDLVHDAIDYFNAFGPAPRVDMQPWIKLAFNSSPSSSVSTWRSPVLLIQGDDDPDVSFHQLVDLVPRLQQYNVPYEAIVLPDEVHGFLRYASWLRADEATAAFFARILR